MTAALITVASIAAYGAIGMLLGVGFYLRTEAGCRDNYCGHGIGAVLGALFWPLGVWLLAGILLATAERRREVMAEHAADQLRRREIEAGLRCQHDLYTVECPVCGSRG